MRLTVRGARDLDGAIPANGIARLLIIEVASIGEHMQEERSQQYATATATIYTAHSSQTPAILD